MSKRKLKRLERDYEALLKRWLEIDLTSPDFIAVDAAYKQAKRELEAARTA